VAQSGSRGKSDALPVRLVNTDEVFLEGLNFLWTPGSAMRNNAARAARSILESAEVEMIFVGESGVIGGVTLYKSRPDKEYSLTDCISMELMRSRDIQEVLTHDRHFAQEGFTTRL
jgi:predicted nucleic acid-binding protein